MRTGDGWGRRAIGAAIVVGWVLVGAAGTTTAASAPARTSAPNAPTHLVATVEANVVVLHWHAPAVSAEHGPAADYLVVWVAPPIEPLTAEVDTHSTATSYRSHFGPGTYRVVATNAAGHGPPSNAVRVGFRSG